MAPKKALTGATDTLELSIEGMTCANCAGRIERALGKVKGVRSATVNLASERARVDLKTPVPAHTLIEAITRAGYHARTTQEASSDAHARHARAQRERWRLILAFTLVLPLILPMVLSPLGWPWCCQPGCNVPLQHPFN